MTSDKFKLEPPPSTLPPGSTVWAYLRDSGGPTQERSIDQQRALIVEYCAQHGLVLALPPFEDVHKSGGTVRNRNDFDYMMSLSASAEKPNGLLIWNFARFSRGGAYESQLYTGTLRARGIVIHSLTDKIPEGEFGPVIETIIHIANKQKKDEAAMGAWRGLRHNVKQGAVSGFPPVGIARSPITIVSEDGSARPAHRWDPDPDYKLRINKAFELKAAGASLSKIHTETKLYGSIHSYLDFFQNPIYMGTLRFGEMIVENYCAATVSRELWEKVQAILTASAERKHLNSKTNHPRRQTSVYLLSGILRCARCEGMFNGMSSPQKYGEDYRRYNCSTAKMKKTCTAKPIPAKLIETMVLDELHRFFDDPQNFVNILESFKLENSTRQQQVDENLASSNAQLATVRKGIANTTNAIEQHGYSNALSKRLTALEEEETSILSRIAQLKATSTQPVKVPTLEQARQHCHLIQADLKSKDPAFIRQRLLSMVSEVYADRTGKFVIARINMYHSPTVKKKIRHSTVSISVVPVGAPVYRHSIWCEGKILFSGRPKKKPVM